MRLLFISLEDKDMDCKVRSVDRLGSIMDEVLLVRREIFVVSRIEMYLIFVKIQREVVISVELVPFRNVTVKKSISTRTRLRQP